MKKFLLTVLCAAVFFIGVGGLIERAGAKYKSDERALAIIAQARQAIGGDAAIQNVKSLTISGQTMQTLNFDGVSRTEQGELDIALQLPDKFSKRLTIGHSDETAGTKMMNQENRVIIINKSGEHTELAPAAIEVEPNIVTAIKGEDGKITVSESAAPNNPEQKVVKRIVIAHADGGEMTPMRQNELLRTTFALLLSAPEGTDANYTYAGESSVDGNKCDLILTESGGASFKLCIDQNSHLPLSLKYQGALPLVVKFKSEINKADENSGVKTVIINQDGQQTGNQHVLKVLAENAESGGQSAGFEVKFSDYRSVGGLQLPYKWTQTANGKPDQSVDVTAYEINPANIAEKFNHPAEKIMIRTAKPQ